MPLLDLIFMIFIGVIFLCIIVIVIATIYKLLYCIFLSLHCILKPCCCQDTPTYYDLIDDFSYFVDNIFYCSCKISLPQIRFKCKLKNTKIKPHCDNFHIIVVNPHNQFQIGTVSTVVNSV